MSARGIVAMPEDFEFCGWSLFRVTDTGAARGGTSRFGAR
jgi:hypothetical protein